MKNTERVLRALRRAQVRNVARMRARAAKAEAFDWLEEVGASAWYTLTFEMFYVRSGATISSGVTLLDAVKNAKKIMDRSAANVKETLC